MQNGNAVAEVDTHVPYAGAAPDAILSIGRNGNDGDLRLFDHTGQFRVSLNSDGRLNLWRSGDIMAPATNIGVVLKADPSLSMRVAGKQRILLDGVSANVFIGGNGVAGDLALFPATVNAPDTDNPAKASISLSGSTGDIVLANADCAEEFEVESPDVEPGAVLVIGDDGKMRESSAPYDTRVAGVTCGAGDCRPGIILGRTASGGRRVPIALMGRVFCKVDAERGAIGVGDLLTTSPHPGHAMKVADRSKAFGAVIGKALRPLTDGTGHIPILIALQ
jgi:hypothetical protein